MNNYWEERTRANAQKAEKEAANYARRLNSTLHNAAEEIDRYIADLLVSGETPTRSQLWRAGRYLQLRQAIEQQCRDIGQRQITLLDELLPKLFDEILGVNLDAFNAAKTPFAFVPNRLIKQTLDTAWSGQSYSSRIWINTNVLAAKLEQDITDYIILGKSRTQITHQIREDFKVSWNKADRLFRTESAHVATEAAKESYRRANITKVKWIHGNGHCDCPICVERDGKIYDLNNAPTLPAHPNCVCCFAPVVDLTIDEKDDIIIPADMRRQTVSQLKKGLKTSDKVIERHLYKIAHPEEFYSDWNDVPEETQEGRIKHWQKEVKIARRNKKAAERLIREKESNKYE